MKSAQKKAAGKSPDGFEDIDVRIKKHADQIVATRVLLVKKDYSPALVKSQVERLFYPETTIKRQRYFSGKSFGSSSPHRSYLMPFASRSSPMLPSQRWKLGSLS